MSTQGVKPRTRRCWRCKCVLGDTDRGRFCDTCYEAVRPRCPECGESLIWPDETGVCYRCWSDSDYWIEQHMEEEA